MVNESATACTTDTMRRGHSGKKPYESVHNAAIAMLNPRRAEDRSVVRSVHRSEQEIMGR